MAQTRQWSFKYQVSSPSQDPFLLIEFLNQSHAILFDCGVRVWGKVKVLLKLEHLFITHAHIDHLIGFDHILRAMLGENRKIHIYGPPGIKDRINNKLCAYDWDRAADQELILEVHELGSNKRIKRVHECKERFQITSETIEDDWDGIAVETPLYTVRALEVNHGGSPCMAYSFSEIDRYRIDKQRLLDNGFKPGPWVGKLLKILNNPDDDITDIEVDGKQIHIANLKKSFVEFQKGRKVTYVTDTIFTSDMLPDLVKLAANSDILISESTFLEEDADLAKKYHHLTARQAATIAKESHVRRLILFHVSSRYFPKMYRAAEEAKQIFPRTSMSRFQSNKRKNRS